MQLPILIENICDLRNYPIIVDLPEKAEVSIGDLHGNAIKLLQFLIQYQVIEMSQTSYEVLVSFYDEWLHLIKHMDIQAIKDKLKKFNIIIATIKLKPKAPFIRLIGDELADRGRSDYFTLKLLNLLKPEKIEIILSNHGYVFIKAYEKYAENKKFATKALASVYIQSMENLNFLIETQLIHLNEITPIIKKFYPDAVKLLSATLHPHKKLISIFTHAPVGLETIKALAKEFRVSYVDTSATALAMTIDKINEAFAKIIRDKNSIFLNLPTDHPIATIMWNRDYTSIERPAIYNDYAIHFIHGHDSSERSHDNIYNLDSLYGKEYEGDMNAIHLHPVYVDGE